MTHDFLADPRALTLPARRSVLAAMPREQAYWLERLRALAEPPHCERDFPAFLLATPPFKQLAARLAAVSARNELPVDVADELDWFVRAFRDYLRTADGEDVFSAGHRSLVR